MSEPDQEAENLPPGWIVLPFDECFRNVTSGKLKLATSSYQVSGRFPVVDQGEQPVGGYSDDETLLHPMNPPLVVFGDHTRCIKLVRTRFIQGADGVKVLAASAAISPDYGFWVLRATAVPSRGYARHFALLRKLRLPVAPQRMQGPIVAAIESHFSRLDAATATLERVQRNLKRYRASVLKAAVEGRLVPTEAELAKKEGRSYEPAAVLLKRILAERRRRWEQAELAKLKAKGKAPTDDRWKARYVEPAAPDTDGFPKLPEGWCWASLEAITSAVRVICYGILMPKEHVPGGVPYVKVRDMKSGRLDVANLQRTSSVIAQQYERASLRGGDLLLAIRGTYGRVVDVPEELAGGNITQDSARIDLMHGAERRYVKYALLSPGTQKYFERVARGVAVKGVNIGQVRPTPIALPPVAEQHRISEAVEDQISVIDVAEDQTAANTARIARLRQSILKWAFEGRLVDPESTGEQDVSTPRTKDGRCAPSR